MKIRNIKLDNIKAFLIFLVVLGHVIERLGTRGELYNWIYLFHMPIFVIITGITFKKYIKENNIKKIIEKNFDSIFNFSNILYCNDHL